MTIRSILLSTLPAVLFLVTAVFFWAELQRDNSGFLASNLVGKAAPSLTLSQLGTDRIPERSDLDAPVVKLANFWASWCAPCRAEHPNLMALAQAGIPIIGVNYKDQPEKALGFIEELGNPYSTIGADSTGRNAINWGVYGIPETFVIDENGIILLRWPGPVTRRVLDQEIIPLLNPSGVP